MYEILIDFRKDFDTVKSVVLLGVSAKLRKASTGFLIYTCLSVGSRLPLDGIISLESLETIQDSLKSDTNNRYFTRRLKRLMIISR